MTGVQTCALPIYKQKHTDSQALDERRKLLEGNEAMQGVWFEDHKIASIGLAFSKWVSRHGFDINLNTPENRIESVEGCGLPVGKHTSLSKFGYNISIEQMQNLLLQTMPEILGREVSNISSLENL